MASWPLETRGSREKTLLVIDDEPGVRSLLRHALARRYRVLEAGDFDEAARVLEREEVHLVLLDLHLPPHPSSACEGLRVQLYLRERSPDLPVVVVSGDGNSHVREHVLGLGAREFLPKPVDAEQLMDVVREVLEG